MPFTPLKRAVRPFSLLIAVLVASGGALAAADADKAAQKGKILADSGFRPKPNGFGFENWGGNEYPYSDLTADDAEALFGEKVCARKKNDQCVPTPAAKLWIKEMNQMMKGGHCEGMAAMSAAFYVKEESPADYGAKQTFGLKPKEQDLMRTISSYFVTQALDPVRKATADTRKWPLQKIVDYIAKTLSAGKDFPTLGIYGGDGGHAITPYMVEQRGESNYRIYVYDNNYPGAEKYVDIDTKRDRWVYAGAALNPKEDASPWEGGAGAMDVTLLSTRYEPLQCPFCGQHKPPKKPKQPKPPKKPKHPQKPRKPSIASDGYSVFTPNRCSQVQATRKKDKKQLTAGKNGVKNEIDGASMLPLRGARGCYVRLPRDEQYDLVLVDDGRPYYRPMTDMVIFAPGNVYSISNVSVSVNVSQTFSFSQTSFTYQAGGSQKPTMRIAGDAAGRNGYYEVSGFSLSEGYQFSAAQDSSGRMVFNDNDPNLDSYDIHAEVVGETETESFEFNDVTPGEHGQTMLDIEADGDMELDIDSDSDGTPNDFDNDDDNDGTPDTQDTDDDGDGTSDDNEALDSDHDSIPDEVDTDDDNDGIADDTDPDDHTQDPGDQDSDHDGVEDAADQDDDNDGTPDAKDQDDDGDGVADDKDPDSQAEASDDADHDGIIDEADTDDDNDGKPDAQDTDDDGDGVADDQEIDETDTDHDGTPDETDADDDNDGTPDAQDPDDDGDGMSDLEEANDSDSDQDGIPDETDGDDDNDGISDAQDADDDGDGLNDGEETDTDHDGTMDAEDKDDDNDGTPDAQDADDDGDGMADDQEVDTMDSDQDGVADEADTDDDNDGVADAQDGDDDGDGLSDAEETDSDHDGTMDAEDTDDDNDGTADAQDGDDDGDGMADAEEEVMEEEPAEEEAAEEEPAEEEAAEEEPAEEEAEEEPAEEEPADDGGDGGGEDDGE